MNGYQEYNLYPNIDSFDENFYYKNDKYLMQDLNFKNFFADNNFQNQDYLINNLNNNQNYSASNLNLNDPYDGFIKGNIYKNLYDQYKNYKPIKLVANSEKEEMLLNLDKLCFFSHELRLYLDNYPNDRNVIQLFNQYRQMANDALYNYEQQYGPICWNALSVSNEFGWESTNWPWEKEVM